MIKIFIGTSANGEDAEAEMTLEYTLRKHSSEPIEITWMRQTKDLTSPWGGWKTNQWATPFSGFRWAIPEVCGFKGKAIYLDVDMLCFKDIAELWNTDLGDKPMLSKYINARWELSVILFDCKKMQQHLPSIEELKKLPSAPRVLGPIAKNITVELDTRWNVLDGELFTIPEMYILHYTIMATQPWKPKWFTGNPKDHHRPELKRLWFNLKDEAVNAGCKPPAGYEPFGKYDIIGKV